MKVKKYIITGPPGAGKTTLINQLAVEGVIIIPEASREIIIAQQLNNGKAVPWEDIETYAVLVFEAIKNRLKNNPEAVFTDRSMLDIIAYLEFYNKLVFDDLLNFPFSTYYHQTVFFAPSWQEIYKIDPQRPQQYSELQGLAEKLQEVYQRFGFNCVILSKVSVESRIKFILKKTTALLQ
ncbi:AAA family ATPase [Flavobacterium sp. 7A]|uniref:AAA family ATPase n=1 Tax=Flavobacterium sp. 7A TaxID=2940571 RepID=UPI0022269933|nr:AAA family ATPase [Flavobacterium sp. 7A]MCW2119671.1 putative ATPase [Flavobacterium sp. 7A]